MKKIASFLLPLVLAFSCTNGGTFSGKMNLSDIETVCDTVAAWQISNFDRIPHKENPGIKMNQIHWSAGVLYIGMYKWADYFNRESGIDFLKKIGCTNDWGLYDKRTPYHADDICIGQMYLAMSERFGCEKMKAATVERANYIASNPSSSPLSKKDSIGRYDRWSWCDALFMAPPVYAALYRQTGDVLYRNYFESEFKACTDSLFDTEEQLYFRDCIRRENKEPNGAKEFWARGNAWVFAGIALLLDNVPSDFNNRAYYEDIFCKMASSVIRCQGKDGSWRPSMLDHEHFPMAENSSSALFCYGLAWGIRHGLLDAKTYMTALEKGWKALCSYVQSDGKLGFVQPIGAFPLGGITADDTQLYAVGGFLLAGTEITRLLKLPCIGTLKTKTLSETHNDLTIGCETLDRNYADYNKYKGYLEPLGMRKLRLQAGWAKTEQVKGEYNFAWLDSIVNDAVSRGLVPWLETSYGNPIYEGGGTPFLAGGWPTSDEAKAAWDAWVLEMATRYKGKVNEWEIWNEPDINKEQFKDYLSYVDLVVRTAKIIRSVNPNAKIAAFAWAYCTPDIFDDCLKALQDGGNLDLIDWVTYHLYRYRPEDIYPLADELQAVLDKYSTRIKLRQGETGAPSVGRLAGALGEYDWTEVSQGKWDIRRMMSDKARNIPTTVFTISDFQYSKNDHLTKKNMKGLLETDEAFNIVRPKLSYFAVQNLATLWDEADTPVDASRISVESPKHHSLYAFKDAETGLESFTLWHDEAIPTDCGEFVLEKVFACGLKIKDPVCVDVRTGKVYKLNFKKENGGLLFENVPVYDSPVMVIDQSLVKLK